ncbi:VOC family protein [Halalkalibaculum sp. DA3122]|uniref:VOC family protein n=1 Tax=unclassified Halalkalibaculum TaxID=2964617 RepID=UPI00375496C1
MKTAATWFEIPVKKLSRAKKFYEGIFEVELIDMEMGDDFKMAMFPVEDGGMGGALCEGKEFYIPSHEGSLIYLNAEPRLQSVVDRIEKHGGKILRPKTQISEEYGYMAIFEDTEGNRVALHAMK